MFSGRSDLGAVAKKALLINSSYMRRVWTIQEAVASQDLNVWPMQGRGELNSYQSIYVIDWPQFNAWNGWPGIGELRESAASNTAIQSYLDGDFSAILKCVAAADLLAGWLLGSPTPSCILYPLPFSKVPLHIQFHAPILPLPTPRTLASHPSNVSIPPCLHPPGRWPPTPPTASSTSPSSLRRSCGSRWTATAL